MSNTFFQGAPKIFLGEASPPGNGPGTVSGLNVDEPKLSSLLTLRVELKERKLNSEIILI